MNIYNTFYYSAAHPVASGNLVAFRQVKRVYPFEAAYRRTIIFRLQELFAGKTEELRKACEALGGTLLPQGDVGYVHEENVVCVAADAVYYLTLAAGMTPEKIYAQ